MKIDQKALNRIDMLIREEINPYESRKKESIEENKLFDDEQYVQERGLALWMYILIFCIMIGLLGLVIYFIVIVLN